MNTGLSAIFNMQIMPTSCKHTLNNSKSVNSRFLKRPHAHKSEVVGTSLFRSHLLNQNSFTDWNAGISDTTIHTLKRLLFAITSDGCLSWRHELYGMHALRPARKLSMICRTLVHSLHVDIHTLVVYEAHKGCFVRHAWSLVYTPTCVSLCLCVPVFFVRAIRKTMAVHLK